MMRHSPCPSLSPCMQDMISIQAWLLALADSWPSALEPCALRCLPPVQMAHGGHMSTGGHPAHLCDIMPFNFVLHAQHTSGAYKWLHRVGYSTDQSPSSTCRRWGTAWQVPHHQHKA